MGDYDDPWFYSPPLEEEAAEQAVVDVEAGAKPSTSALSPVSVDAQVAILQAAANSNAHAHAPAPAINTAAASLPVRRGRFLVKPRLLFDWGDPDRHRRVRDLVLGSLYYRYQYCMHACRHKTTECLCV